MPLTDRNTSRLGRALVDGFTSDRIVMVLARVRRTRVVGEEDASVLRRANQLVSRIKKGDSILTREDNDRQAFGSSGTTGRQVDIHFRVGGQNEIPRVQKTLKVLMQHEVPSDDDMMQAEAFFVEIGKGVLRRSQSIEGAPSAPGSFRGYV